MSAGLEWVWKSLILWGAANGTHYLSKAEMGFRSFTPLFPRLLFYPWMTANPVLFHFSLMHVLSLLGYFLFARRFAIPDLWGGEVWNPSLKGGLCHFFKQLCRETMCSRCLILKQLSQMGDKMSFPKKKINLTLKKQNSCQFFFSPKKKTWGVMRWEIRF